MGERPDGGRVALGRYSRGVWPFTLWPIELLEKRKHFNLYGAAARRGEVESKCVYGLNRVPYE